MFYVKCKNNNCLSLLLHYFLIPLGFDLQVQLERMLVMSLSLKNRVEATTTRTLRQKWAGLVEIIVGVALLLAELLAKTPRRDVPYKNIVMFQQNSYEQKIGRKTYVR